jgi:hypothetical protein
VNNRIAFLATIVLSILQSTSVPSSAPLVSIWYRGHPAGVPKTEDLAAIRARGFAAVTWPFASETSRAALRRLADQTGLAVVGPDSVPLAAVSALRGEQIVDVRVAKVPAAAIAPIAWRAIGRGARVIAFDAGLSEGSGLTDEKDRTPAWVLAAADVARQLHINGGLFGVCQPGPAVTIDSPRSPSLDVVLLDAGKSWVVMATNASRARIHAVAHLPPGVPYALWLNLLNGSTMAMLSQPAGPRWDLDMEGWGVRIYVIDKVLK